MTTAWMMWKKRFIQGICLGEIDFPNIIIYYTRKKVTHELLSYEYIYWRVEDESVLLPRSGVANAE